MYINFIDTVSMSEVFINTDHIVEIRFESDYHDGTIPEPYNIATVTLSNNSTYHIDTRIWNKTYRKEDITIMERLNTRAYDALSCIAMIIPKSEYEGLFENED